MRILLLGKNGQVGWELQRSLLPLGEVICLDRAGELGLVGDLSDLAGLQKTIEKLKPQVVVNAAAYTAVDKAESETGLADVINHQAVAVMAKTCKKLGALLVQYSTDYVFPGTGSSLWSEGDAVSPENYYGQSKLQAEVAILNSGCQYLIFRTSWVYAAKGANFAKTMLKLAKEHTELGVISDQVGAPTGAELIADVTSHAIPATLADSSKSGLYHLAAAGEVSWFEYADFVFTKAEELGVQLSIKDLKAIPTSDYPTPAARPLNSRLNCMKLENTFNLALPDWRVGVERMLDEILER